jgi:hypothetical protein
MPCAGCLPGEGTLAQKSIKHSCPPPGPGVRTGGTTVLTENCLPILVHFHSQTFIEFPFIKKAYATTTTPCCSAVCLLDGQLNVRWRVKGHKDGEAVLCENCGTTCPVPRSMRGNRVSYRILSKRRKLSVQRVAPRNRRSQVVIDCGEQ